MDFQFLQSLRPNVSEYTTVDEDDDDAIAVAEFVVSTPEEQIQKVKNNDPTVTSADFRYKNLRADQIKELTDALKTNTHVRELHLDGNDLTADNFRSLSDAMKSNRSIDTLNVNFTALDDPSAKLLLDALNSRPAPLKALHCLGNQLSPQTERLLVGHVTRVTESSDGFRLAVSRLEGKLTDEESRTALNALTKRLAALEASETKLKSQLADLQRSSSVDSLHASTSNLSLSGTGHGNKDVSLDPSVLKALGRKFIDVNNVQINEKIAETGGSNAGIFACHVDGWLCAMKELDVKQLSDSNIKAFESEIELLENLPYHLNICRYLFHEKTGDKIRLYITKYNCSLRHIVNKQKDALANQKDFKTFSAKHITKWCVDIASGMAFLHKHQIMHRDLKPDNVFVNLDVHGDVKQCAIGDFDTAKRVSKSQQAKTTVGTYCYMAPEVFRSQNMATYSFAIDIWSFGMLMYELLALKQPYEDEDAFDVPQFVVSGKRPQLPSLHESYDELIQIFKECTEVSPDVRPSMETLRDKLMRLHWSQTA